MSYAYCYSLLRVRYRHILIHMYKNEKTSQIQADCTQNNNVYIASGGQPIGVVMLCGPTWPHESTPRKRSKGFAIACKKGIARFFVHLDNSQNSYSLGCPVFNYMNISTI